MFLITLFIGLFVRLINIFVCVDFFRSSYVDWTTLIFFALHFYICLTFVGSRRDFSSLSICFRSHSIPFWVERRKQKSQSNQAQTKCSEHQVPRVYFLLISKC